MVVGRLSWGVVLPDDREEWMPFLIRFSVLWFLRANHAWSHVVGRVHVARYLVKVVRKKAPLYLLVLVVHHQITGACCGRIRPQTAAIFANVLLLDAGSSLAPLRPFFGNRLTFDLLVCFRAVLLVCWFTVRNCGTVSFLVGHVRNYLHAAVRQLTLVLATRPTLIDLLIVRKFILLINVRHLVAVPVTVQSLPIIIIIKSYLIIILVNYIYLSWNY